MLDRTVRAIAPAKVPARGTDKVRIVSGIRTAGNAWLESCIRPGDRV